MRSAVIMLALTTAAALAAGPATAPAGAATRTWTVAPGGAVTAKAGTTKLTDRTTGSFLTCKSSEMSGTFASGSGLPGAGIGSVTAASYRCSAPVGILHVTPSALPWRLNLTGYDASTGVSSGTLSHVRLVLTYTACDAVISGTSATTPGQVPVRYASKTGTLRLLSGGTLHWYRVQGCAGLLGDGHPASLTASYTLSPKQVITSP
jgi:hypothetical protein